MQTFNIGDPVTCIVYGNGQIVDFDSSTSSPLKMWICFGFQPDPIPYTLDGRLHPNANITLRHIKKQSLQSMMISEGSRIPDKVAYLESNGWQSYKHHDNWVKCNWSDLEKERSLISLNSAFEQCVGGQEKAIRHNQGKSTWSLVDFATMEDMVAVLDFGAKKYSPDNWKKGLHTKSVFDSIMRHLAAYISGEDNDQESGLPHTGHIMCNAMFLAYMHKFMPSSDNRDKKPTK